MPATQNMTHNAVETKQAGTILVEMVSTGEEMPKTATFDQLDA